MPFITYFIPLHFTSDGIVYYIYDIFYLLFAVILQFLCMLVVEPFNSYCITGLSTLFTLNTNTSLMLINFPSEPLLSNYDYLESLNINSFIVHSKELRRNNLVCSTSRSQLFFNEETLNNSFIDDFNYCHYDCILTSHSDSDHNLCLSSIILFLSMCASDSNIIIFYSICLLWTSNHLSLVFLTSQLTSI